MESCNYDFVFLLLTHSCAIVFRVWSVSVVLSNSLSWYLLGTRGTLLSYGRVPVHAVHAVHAVVPCCSSIPSSSSRSFTKFHSSSSSSSILVSFAGSHFELPNTTTTRTHSLLTQSTPSLNQQHNRQHNILLRASIRSSNSNTGTSNRPHLILSRDQNKRLA